MQQRSTTNLQWRTPGAMSYHQQPTKNWSKDSPPTGLLAPGMSNFRKTLLLVHEHLPPLTRNACSLQTVWCTLPSNKQKVKMVTSLLAP